MELADFLDRPFVIDYLYPVYGDLPVNNIFEGWTGKKKNSWHEFRNPDGDVLEFYPEGTYILKRKQNYLIKQLKTPQTIREFVCDLSAIGINFFLER